MIDRKCQITQQLREFLSDLGGQEITESQTPSSFIELGFDSLFLTQAASAMKSRFGVKVTFRQLLETLTSIDTLASHIDRTLPPAAPPKAVPNPNPAPEPHPKFTPSTPSVPLNSAPPSTPKTSGGPQPNTTERALSSTVLERVIQEQLKVMEHQLSLLRQSSPGSFKVAVPASVQPELQAPASAALIGMSRDSNTSPATDTLSKEITRPETSAVESGSTPMAQHGPFKPIDKGIKGGLVDIQQAHLDWLIPRYVAKTPKSKAYTERYRKSFADPRAVSGFKQNWKEMVYPIVSTRSLGANIWDLDGNRWVDVTMGFGVALLGHSPHFINEAVKKQLDLGIEIGPQSPLSGEVAELICEFTGMERVTFCNTGSEAVMAALRICRTVTGRTKIVLFAGAYHGTFDEVLVKGATVKGQPRTLAIAPGVAPNLIESVVVLEYGAPQSLVWLREHAEELAAVLVETVQSRHPGLQPREFLKEVRTLTRQAETPLIFDEVITGFRCHPGGAQKYFDIEADLATYGKIVGGGMPFGFLAGKAWLMDAFDGGQWQYGDESFPPTGVTFFAGTFVRHPLAMAAAKAMLAHLKEQGPELQAELARRTDRMLGELNRYFSTHNVPLHIEHFTSIWYPHFGSEIKSGSLLYFHLREKGLHIWEGRPCFLSTAHTAEDEAFIERAFKLSVAEMQLGGFLPGTSDPEFASEASKRRAESAPIVETRQAQSVPPPARPSAEGAIPLTEGQVEMWLGAQIDPEASGTLNACSVLEFTGALDERALESAIQQVIHRHEALRATVSPDGLSIQIAPFMDAALVHHTLTDLPRPERAIRVQSILQQEGARLFDLSKGPLFHLDLIKLSATENLLVFTINMIACDGWGINIVLEEIGEIYSASVESRPAALRPIVPLRDYAAWLSEPEQQEAAKAAADFWLSQFKSLPLPVDLPCPAARPSRRTVSGDRTTLRLGAELYSRLRETAKAQGGTPFALLFAAYQTWLSRLTGQTDLVIGVPYAGQSAMGSETIVGQCVHILPIRARFDAEMPFAELLRLNRNWVLDAQENWNCSFGSIAQKLDLPHDTSRIPLVSVLFNLDPPMSKVRFSGLERRISSGPRVYFQYDLGFNLVDEGQELLVELDYNSRLFPADLMEIWLSHFQTLLEAAVVNPACKLGLLPMLGAQDLDELLKVGGTGTGEESKDTLRVEDLFSQSVRQFPHAIALELQGRRLTYSELDKQSNRVARLLKQSGIRRGSIVGLAVPRSTEMVVALLGTLKAGAGYVPLDLSLPPSRLTHMLEDSAASLVLTLDEAQKSIPPSSAQVICLDIDPGRWESLSDAPLKESSGDSEDVAYLIYTSGSTGKPKGVLIRHRSAVNFLRSMQNEPGITAQDAVLAITTLSFDISVLEMFLPLSVGARIVLLPRETAMDPHLLSDAIEQARVTLMQATPATWRLLVNSGWKGHKGLKALVGGEALSGDLAERLIEGCGSLWNMYGPTETTVWSSVSQVKDPRTVSLGHPIANTQLYVVDEQLRPVPVGVPGELLIGGAGLALGYQNNPDLTQSRFVDNPFHPKLSPKVYRTGDQVRRLPSGRLDYLGRLDFQVKIRGHRVELQEIESALLQDPRVQEAAVIATEGTPGQAELIAFVVLRTGLVSQESSGPTLNDIRRNLKQSLPEYAVPGRIQNLVSLPKNNSGKIDRKALKPPLEVSDVVLAKATRIAPRTSTEKRLAEIWSKLLKVEFIGATDNFFELGGQSLKAVALFAAVEKDFGKKLPLATLFKAPTLEELASIISGEAIQAQRTWSSLVPIQPRGARPNLFLVHGAGGNVLLYQALARHLAPDYPLYGLQSQGLDAKTPPLENLEAMAALYLSEIKAVQPKGPYFLGGYCMGGTIAYEMAQTLTAQGETVALVAMLDTYNFAVMGKSTGPKAVLQKLKFHVGNFVKLRPGEMLDYVKEKVRVAKDGELKNWIGRGAKEPKADQSSEARESSVQSVNDEACMLYAPKPYTGSLTLFKPKVNYDFYPDPNMGWGDLVRGGLHHVEMPVNPHAMIVEPYVQDLARLLKESIESSSKTIAKRESIGTRTIARVA